MKKNKHELTEEQVETLIRCRKPLQQVELDEWECFYMRETARGDYGALKRALLAEKGSEENWDVADVLNLAAFRDLAEKMDSAVRAAGWVNEDGLRI